MTPCAACLEPGQGRVYDGPRYFERDGNTVALRRRRCDLCGARWVTEETFVRLIEVEGERFHGEQRRDQLLAGEIRSNLHHTKNWRKAEG